MPTLYVDRKDSELRMSSGVLHISTPDGHGNRSLPIKYLDRVVLRADTKMSSKVLCGLAEGGVNLIVIGGRSGNQIAQMIGASHNDSRIRWKQVLALSQPEVCCKLACSIVQTKVRRQLATLQHIALQRLDLRKPLFDGQKKLQRILQTLKSEEIRTYDLNQVRGLEGAAAAGYFEAYFCAFSPVLGASGRNRRPPRDPVNALLSLSYTMLCSQATGACWSAGLDPAMGALHAISHSRPALACDIMEPYRPKVDLWVWQMFRENQIRAEHFGHDGSGACLLGKAGRGHFYSAWEQYAKLNQRSLLRYGRAIARALSAGVSSDAWAHLQDIEPDHQ
jgi:CRISPR-associated protein Cas1